MGLPDENSNAAARVTRALYQSTAAALLLLAHPAKTESGDASVRGAGELSADLDVLWNIHRVNGYIRRAKCEKDRDPDLENSALDFSIDPWKTGTRLSRRSHPWKTGMRLSRRSHAHHSESVEEAILAALKEAPAGLKRSDLTLSVKEVCGLGTTTTRDAVACLKSSGAITETNRRLFLRNETCSH